MYKETEIEWEKADCLRCLFLKGSSSITLPLLFRETLLLQEEKCKKQIAQCLFKIGLKPSLTYLIISEVNKLICHSTVPFQCLKVIQMW